MTFARSRRWIIGFLALALLAAVPLLVGCQSKKSLDTKVDVIVSALTQGDYAKLDAVAGPDLKKDLTKPKFDVLAKVVKELGAFKKRKMEGIQVNAGGKVGRYKLEFEKGTVDFELVMKGEEVAGFHLKGDSFQEAAQRARGGPAPSPKK
jgi:hypothetical protein